MTTSKRLSFDQLHNTRDLGGMRTVDGSVIRSGCLIRSSHLHRLSEADQEKLQALIDTVIDFRSIPERSEEEDIILPGITYLHLPVVDDFSSAGITRDNNSQKRMAENLQLEAEDARRLMAGMYTKFPHSEKGNHAFKTFLQVLLEDHPKAVLWHCSAGKDRAGMAAVIIEKILGVSEEDILQDYLATNAYQKDTIAQFKQFVLKQAGGRQLSDETIQYLFGADASYLQAFLDSVDETYGDFETYVRKALGLKPEDIAALRRRYLILESE